MATKWEKSFAVECMHRMSKHYKDVVNAEDAKFDGEFLDIPFLWSVREDFEGKSLNDALLKLRYMRETKDFSNGWKLKGRNGYTAK